MHEHDIEDDTIFKLLIFTKDAYLLVINGLCWNKWYVILKSYIMSIL